MHERAPRPSRLVQSIARWAITLGAAGTVLASSAIYGVLLRKELVASKYKLLLVSAVLLSCAFVLAPLVRRTFGLSLLTPKSKPPARRTLLDEMRETQQLSDVREGETAAMPAPAAEPAVNEPAPMPALAARLVAVAYVIFGAALLTILWLLRPQ